MKVSTTSTLFLSCFWLLTASIIVLPTQTEAARRKKLRDLMKNDKKKNGGGGGGGGGGRGYTDPTGNYGYNGKNYQNDFGSDGRQPGEYKPGTENFAKIPQGYNGKYWTPSRNGTKTATNP
jgi:hypothetical protein